MIDVLIGGLWALLLVVVLVMWAAYGPVAGALVAIVALLGVIVVQLGRRT